MVPHSRAPEQLRTHRGHLCGSASDRRRHQREVVRLEVPRAKRLVVVVGLSGVCSKAWEPAPAPRLEVGVVRLRVVVVVVWCLDPGATVSRKDWTLSSSSSSSSGKGSARRPRPRAQGPPAAGSLAFRRLQRGEGFVGPAQAGEGLPTSIPLTHPPLRVAHCGCGLRPDVAPEGSGSRSSPACGAPGLARRTSPGSSPRSARGGSKRAPPRRTASGIVLVLLVEGDDPLRTRGLAACGEPALDARNRAPRRSRRGGEAGEEEVSWGRRQLRPSSAVTVVVVVGFENDNHFALQR